MFVLAACGGGGGTPSGGVLIGGADNTLYTEGSWTTAAPDTVGFEAAKLQAAAASATSDGTYSQAFLVMKDGMLVSETYRGLGAAPGETAAYQAYLASMKQTDSGIFSTRNAASLATTWSVAKSLVSLLVGIALDKGDIASLDTPASTYISAWRAPSPLAGITIRQLLNMRSGLVPVCVDRATKQVGTCPNYAVGRSGGSIVFADNQLDVCVQNRTLAVDGTAYPWLPPAEGGGQTTWRTGTWVYSNCDPMILAEIIAKTSGMNLQDYANRNLFNKLQMTAHWWSDNMPDGSEHYLGYCCVDATPRDFAKIGQLILNRGLWGSEQVISAAYMDMIRGIHAPKYDTGIGSSSDINNGYAFWSVEADAKLNFPGESDLWITAAGLDGQYIAVDLINNIVLVRNSLYDRLNPNSNRKLIVSNNPAEIAMPVTMPQIAIQANTPASSFDLASAAHSVAQALKGGNLSATAASEQAKRSYAEY